MENLVKIEEKIEFIKTLANLCMFKQTEENEQLLKCARKKCIETINSIAVDNNMLADELSKNL